MAGVGYRQGTNFDIFLPQMGWDIEIVLEAYDLLTEMGDSVFCDWIAAPELRGDAVTPANAAFIRAMMAFGATQEYPALRQRSVGPVD